MSALVVPAFIRGALITEHLVDVDGRGATATFRTPAAAALLERLPLHDPAALGDLLAVTFDEIVDYLVEVGQRLRLGTNTFLQEALDHSGQWSDYTVPVLRAAFEQLPQMFTADAVREVAEMAVGIPYLEGWVNHQLADGRVASIRAFGARAAHIIAGNSPVIAAVTIIRNAVTRSDAIIKLPSNDPLTALAIARTMAQFAPEHPLTRHLSVVYWKGGDTAVESELFKPAHVEKLVAWGGLATVTHVSRYVRPGIELITLDPKRSATIIGPEAFTEEAMPEAALRVATDIGALNQLGCVNARVVYISCGLDGGGIDWANRFGQEVYTQLLALPETVSTKARVFDPELRAQINGLRSSPDWYRVYGGREDEGAVIVSQIDETVDFCRSLSGRVANIVPLAHVEDVLPRIDSSTQTIGVYPETTRVALSDALALRGAQRIVSLGYAALPNPALPQDAIEPTRRMVKWVIAEECDPIRIEPLWAPRSTNEKENAL